MNLNHHFFLSDDAVLVNGAKNSVLLDLQGNKVYRVNASAKQVIELGERGLRLMDVMGKCSPELETSDVLSFVREIGNLGLLKFSAKPKSPNLKKRSSPKLDFLWIELTSRCNLRCIHCYAESESVVGGEVKQLGVLCEDEVKKLIDEAAALGCRKLQFTGGEPMLRRDLRELIEHAGARGFEFIEVFTNGTLLTESMIRFLADRGVNVAMSIHSYKAENHDAITGVSGSFEKTMSSLELLLAYGVPTRCATVAMKQNEDDLDGTSYFLSRLGVFDRPPDPIRPSGRGMDVENWPKNYGLRFMQTTPSFLVSREAFERNSQWNSCWCGKIAVTSTGDVIPCVFARGLVAGNVKQQGLTEIIKGQVMLGYWGLTKDQVQVCRDCEFRYVCEDCRPLAYGSAGNLHAKSPRCTYNPYTGDWVGPEIGEARGRPGRCVGT